MALGLYGDAHVSTKLLCLAFMLLLLGMLPLCTIYATPAFSLPFEAKQEVLCLVFIDGGPVYEDRVRTVLEQANRHLEREGAEIVLVPSPVLRRIEFKVMRPGRC